MLECKIIRTCGYLSCPSLGFGGQETALPSHSYGTGTETTPHPQLQTTHKYLLCQDQLSPYILTEMVTETGQHFLKI